MHEIARGGQYFSYRGECSRTVRDMYVNQLTLAERGNSEMTELARITVVIVTPDPTSGTNSTSASTNQRASSRTLAKDTLLLALEAIVRSSDAFPPLKSAASSLLFFATYADVGHLHALHVV